MTATAEYARGLLLLAQGDARIASTHVRRWARLTVPPATRTLPGSSLNQRRRISNVLVPCRTRSVWASCLAMIRASLRGPASG